MKVLLQTIAVPTLVLALSACEGANDTPQEDTARASGGQTYGTFLRELERVYREKPKEYSRAFALIKDGKAGPDWLATFHGLPDNKAACEEAIEPYNDDPSLSALPGTYKCVEIGPGFNMETSPS